jgi:DNA (cytosine-5)-methyltransferase 1
MKKKINHLDLFSGIGGFHLGFERAGYKVTSFFSEIDKHAIAVYKHQFKNSTYVGSVTDLRGSDLPTIDLLTFGSPCQDFSLAGKRKGMEGERSSLILEAIRLIKECRPRVFIWENVKGTFSSNAGEDFAAILQEFAHVGGYRLEWQLLNTSWFLPQNRERIYLVGYSAEPRRDWRGVFPIAGPDQENNGTPAQQGIRSVSHTLCSNYWRFANDSPVIKVKSATSQGYEVATEGDSINLSNPNSETRRGRVGKGKAQTLETSCNQAVIEPLIYDGYNNKVKEDNIVGTITQHCSRSGMTNGFKVIEPIFTYEKVNETIRRNKFVVGEIKAMDLYNKTLRNQSPTLTQPEHNGISLFDGYRIRRLTPIECERLQGFPDNHTAFGIYDGEVKPMSKTHRYKQCGNAVTVDVVQAVAERLKPVM